MAVPASIGSVPISSGENGGIARSVPSRPSETRAHLHFRAEDDTEDGALSFGDSRMEIALRHSIWFSPLFDLHASFLRCRAGFRFRFRCALRRLQLYTQHRPWWGKKLKSPIAVDQIRYNQCRSNTFRSISYRFHEVSAVGGCSGRRDLRRRWWRGSNPFRYVGRENKQSKIRVRWLEISLYIWGRKWNFRILQG